jgi:hypothetical protein
MGRKKKIKRDIKEEMDGKRGNGKENCEEEQYMGRKPVHGKGNEKIRGTRQKEM